MDHLKVFKDSYFNYFDTEDDFLYFLNERFEKSEWRTIETSELRFENLEERTLFSNELEKDYERKGFSGVIEDTINNTRLLLILDGKEIPVRNTAMKTIFERARIGGSVLNDFDKKTLSKILNYSMSLSNGRSLIKIADEKISAIHAGDSCDYKILEIKDIFNKTKEYLEKMYGVANFKRGNFEHCMVSAVWEFSNDKLMDTYRELLENNGVQLKKLKLALKLISSDVGISGANLQPMIIYEDKYFLTLGNIIRLPHKSDASLEKFEKNLNLIFGSFNVGLNKLSELLEIYIHNPVNCMMGLMKKVRLPKKLSIPIIEEFKKENENNPMVTAHDIYLAISEIIFIMQCKGEKGIKIVDAEEKIAKLLNIDWKEYDTSIQVSW